MMAPACIPKVSPPPMLLVPAVGECHRDRRAPPACGGSSSKSQPRNPSSTPAGDIPPLPRTWKPDLRASGAVGWLLPSSSWFLDGGRRSRWKSIIGLDLLADTPPRTMKEKRWCNSIRQGRVSKCPSTKGWESNLFKRLIIKSRFASVQSQCTVGLAGNAS